MSRSTRKWRLNVRAAIILGVLVGVALPALVALSYFRGLSSSTSLLRQAVAQTKAEPPRYDLALNYLNEYLGTRDPEDPETFEALALKSEILAGSARTGSDLQEAARVCQQALRVAAFDANGDGKPDSGLDPASPDVQKIRRRLVAVDLDMVPLVPLDEVPLKAAEDIATQLIALQEQDGGTPDPADLRLKARVLQNLAAFRRDAEAGTEALTLLERAYQQDPADLTSAAELAQAYQFASTPPRPDDARRVLDSLLARLREREAKAPAEGEARDEIAGKIAQAHLTRFRMLATQAAAEPTLSGRRALSAEAATELDQALAKDPDDVDVLLTAAEYAVQNGNLAQAAAYFAKVPDEDRETVRSRLVEGLIALGNNRHDDAIESWRRGLEASGGTDADLTWQLAYILLDLGRVDQADPLIRQHRRLSGNVPGTTEPTPRHRFLEGLALLKRNQPAPALEELRKALLKGQDRNDQRDRPQVLIAMARAFEMLKRPDDAMEQYRQAALARPRWSIPYLARAALIQQQPAAQSGTPPGRPRRVEARRRGARPRPGRPARRPRAPGRQGPRPDADRAAQAPGPALLEGRRGQPGRRPRRRARLRRALPRRGGSEDPPGQPCRRRRAARPGRPPRPPRRRPLDRLGQRPDPAEPAPAGPPGPPAGRRARRRRRLRRPPHRPRPAPGGHRQRPAGPRRPGPRRRATCPATSRPRSGPSWATSSASAASSTRPAPPTPDGPRSSPTTPSPSSSCSSWPTPRATARPPRAPSPP